MEPLTALQIKRFIRRTYARIQVKLLPASHPAVRADRYAAELHHVSLATLSFNFERDNNLQDKS